MTENTLDQVQRLVDELSPLDQVRLLAYIAPRVARVVEASYPKAQTSTHDRTEAWAEFFRVGDAVADSDQPDGETLTATVLAMRR